jgi:hypothetical protein
MAFSNMTEVLILSAQLGTQEAQSCLFLTLSTIQSTLFSSYHDMSKARGTWRKAMREQQVCPV